MARKQKNDPLAALAAIIIVGGCLLWVYVLPPVLKWIQDNAIFIAVTIIAGIILIVIGYVKLSNAEFTPEKEKYNEVAVIEPQNDTIQPIETEQIRRIKEIARHIEEFTPSRQYRDEFGYHTELQGYLKAHYPQSKIEVQTGSSRPDIIIDSTAIEVKGPTASRDLSTIADKMLRYPQYYNHIIVVLFDVQTKDRRYNEWYAGITEHYRGKITVIRK